MRRPLHALLLSPRKLTLPRRFKSYLVKLSPSNTWEYNPLLLISGQPNSFWTYLGASTFSGLCVCTVMQPADTALSRVYNQPTRIDSRGRSVGTLYRGEPAA